MVAQKTFLNSKALSKWLSDETQSYITTRPPCDGVKTLVQQLGLEDDVGLPGFEANPYRYMARAAVFVLSSRWEGLPGVLIEALCCGVSVVATDCPSGPREILANGKYGQLVPVEDVNALTQAIEML